jgi:hypothetical protein
MNTSSSQNSVKEQQDETWTKKRITGVLLPSFILSAAALIFEYLIKANVSVSPTTFIRPLIILWSLLLVLVWPIHKITKQWNWTGIVLFAFVTVFYTSAPLFYIICLLLLGILIIWGTTFFLLKKNFEVKQINNVQFGLSFVVISILLYWLLTPFFWVDWKAYFNSIPNANNTVLAPTTIPENPPDIYFIILDGYADKDVLQKYYQYDNSDIIEYLKELGFTIPTKTHSNYAKTSVSVPSTLNFDYIQNFTHGIENSIFWWLMDPFVQESRAHLFLKKAGYQTIALETDWDITNNTHADLYLSPYQFHLTQFEGAYLAKTQLNALKPWISKVAFVPSFESHQKLLEFNFETLKHIPELPGPKFVFAHIVAPHPPFIIDDEGNHTEPSYGFTFNDAENFFGLGNTSEDYKTGYLNKLEFANAELKKTIEAILSKSEVPPIILIQADHGPGLRTDFSSSENTCLEERFSIFSAYYLPNLDHNPIPEHFSSVNIFRIVFNEYFSTDLPILENKSYYYFDTIKIYHTEDITMRLEKSSNSIACTKPLE